MEETFSTEITNLYKLSFLLMDNRRMSNRLDSLSERYEMLQDNVEGYRKDIASLREKEQKMAAASQKHEQTLHALNEDLRAAKEKLAMAEGRAESLHKERDMLKLVESRLTQEKETILSQQQTQSLLLSNLQTIQATLERSETDTVQRLFSQLEKQEREISQLQKRLEHEVEQRHLLSRNQEIQEQQRTTDQRRIRFADRSSTSWRPIAVIKATPRQPVNQEPPPDLTEATPSSEGLKALWDDYASGSKGRKQLLERRYGRSRLLFTTQEFLSEEWITEKCKNCPHCFRRIQKISGCNSMICSQCKRRFCWACLTKLDLPETLSHFSTSPECTINMYTYEE